jgi:hypothetical protein
MSGRIEALNAELAGLRAEKEKLEEVAAEAERGTAKGRSYEEEVAAAVDAIALPLGDDAQAVGDQRESTGKKGDVVVAIGASHGPAQGRIVFEAKDRRLSRPGALQELDACMAERNADFAVLVVPTVDEMPAKMHPLREYNGDKLIVVYDLDDGPLALQVAYSLARAPGAHGPRRGRRRGHRRGDRHRRARRRGARRRPPHPPAAHRCQDADRQGVGHRRRDERSRSRATCRRSRRSCARGRGSRIRPQRPARAAHRSRRSRPWPRDRPRPPEHPTLL